MGEPLDSADNPAKCADMVKCLSARSHRYSVNGERREFRMEEWADADGVIHLFAFTVTDYEPEPEKSRSTSRALAMLEKFVRGNLERK